LPTQNELNGIPVVPVKNPISGATPIPANAINPISQQIIGFFKQVPGLPVSGVLPTALATNDYSNQVPFSDKSDKGDFRSTVSKTPTTPGSSASAIAKRPASTFLLSRCPSTARPTARSVFSSAVG
jgi:hypothetical protein